MKNKYQAGANFERRVAKWYEGQGAMVIRSAGSHGVCDVIALFPTVIILNTLRINSKWSPIEREQFLIALRNLRSDGLSYRGRYVWRGDKSGNYKIHYTEIMNY
jgi:hypothetical protein